MPPKLNLNPHGALMEKSPWGQSMKSMVLANTGAGQVLTSQEREKNVEYHAEEISGEAYLSSCLISCDKYLPM